MKKEEIEFMDWQRILLGNAPVEFLLEVVVRTCIIYVVLLLVMRLLGKRMNAQLTRIELAVMIMLGGIVSVGMEVPDRGLAHSALILVCTLLLFRFVNWLTFRYRQVELLTQGDLQILLVDGVLDWEAMRKANLSCAQLFASLRTEDIRHLGQLKRVYLETNGEFSLYRQAEPKPGLSVLPAPDVGLHQDAPRAEDLRACGHCGYTEPEPLPSPQSTTCPRCGASAWTYAVSAS
ncbi:DUF421 domain-containing protein [Hymenobacter aerilatus]|uniref:DUF421 domain-containing protein n=1 Tax=Hymenobacter aerilatus TaxID=2932251 RepID=A0A8T9T159_9BACT|nr:YetF domain-containing protein [Hymenobacter aerilatus]UOR07371.1 DUF421 domain-containing protein [Hymenobacter aerilatus]